MIFTVGLFPKTSIFTMKSESLFRHQPSMFIVPCHWWTWPSQGPWLCDALGDHRRTPTGRRAGRFPGAEKTVLLRWSGDVFWRGKSSQKIDEQWDYIILYQYINLILLFWSSPIWIFQLVSFNNPFFLLGSWRVTYDFIPNRWETLPL